MPKHPETNPEGPLPEISPSGEEPRREPHAPLHEQLRTAVGETGLLTDPTLMASYESDWRAAHKGRVTAVVRPASTDEVAAVLKICHETDHAVIPQGGNTGLCGGAVPDDSGTQIILSLNRMRRIRTLDKANHTITVEAGAVLADVRKAAHDANLLFPLSLGAEGSCTIGGNLATNAGGTAVLRYGTMRDLTLGLEVVLPDGRVWHGLRALRKDNTGYDLKHLFIGAEGTLGVITAAVLRLFPAVRARATAWVALASPREAVDLINQVRARTGDRLTTFELMSRQAVEFVLRHGNRDPFREPHPWYALVELTDTLPTAALDEVLADALTDVTDAVLATGPAQTAALWALREGISEAQNHEGPSLKHDITVPISDLPAFVERAAAALERAVPGIRLVTYGHVGDGNLHYNLSKPPGTDDAAFAARADELARIVYDTTAAFGGSISAEHGLGQSKRETVRDYKPAVELDLMSRVKRLLDPAGLMNPGKVV